MAAIHWIGTVTEGEGMDVAQRVTAPGRVNLIGDHTDYNQGVALPMAIDLGTTVELTANASPELTFFTTLSVNGISLPRDLPSDPSVVRTLEPPWARLVGAMIAMVHPDYGGIARIETNLPIGAGLSSSAALMVALAGALGAVGPARTIASLCQQAENLSGVPVGIMDPLVCAGGRAGHAMLIDFSDTSFVHVPIPEDAELVIVDSGVGRTLRFTAYGARVAECEAAAVTVGPLGRADDEDVTGIRDPVLRRRTRHVVTECRRVHEMSEALAADDLSGAGSVLVRGHRSLAEDFEVSTPVVDSLIEHLCSLDGVYGARMTGAGFGGSVVALCRPGASEDAAFPDGARVVVASEGAAGSDESAA